MLICYAGYDAVNAIMRVIGEQSQPTFDENYNVISYYHWSGQPGSMSPPVPNGGNGEPKGYTGMVGTHHRPSDDLVVYCTETKFSSFVPDLTFWQLFMYRLMPCSVSSWAILRTCLSPHSRPKTSVRSRGNSAREYMGRSGILPLVSQNMLAYKVI